MRLPFAGEASAPFRFRSEPQPEVRCCSVSTVFGTANSNGNASIYAAGGFRYLSDFYTLTLYAVLVVSPDHPCSMFVPSELCEDRGRRVSWVKDVRHSLDYASDVVRACQERGVTDGKAGGGRMG